jgi:predicted amidohydrolase YtcJ
MALANTVALHKAGIAKTTPDPAGGVIVRDPRTGEPTGVLKDAAMNLVAQNIPVPSVVEDDQAFEAAMKEASKNGITSVHDITPWSSFETFQRARSHSALNVRIYARTPLSQWEEQASWIKRNGVGDDWLKLGGLKAFMDGSLGSATAYFFEAYEDTPSSYGLLVDDAVPLGKMERRMLAADQAGLQLSIHAIGDRANHILLNLFQKVAESNGLRDRRFRTEHAQHLRRDDIPRFARLGVVASMQPYQCADDGRWAGKHIGPERIKTTYAFRSLLESGAIVTFGSDWTVAPINPLLGIYAAVTRQTLDGRNPQGWVPQEKISLEEALRCYTINNAYAAFEERQKGSIEVGKLGDLVVLDRDLFAIPPEDIPNTKILYTIVGGRVVYELA